MGSQIPQKNKLLLLALSGIGAALFWKIGAMTNATQKVGFTPGGSAGAPGEYAQKQNGAEQKCCDKPPSKSALMLAR
jgi:hypothetical protein